MNTEELNEFRDSILQMRGWSSKVLERIDKEIRKNETKEPN